MNVNFQVFLAIFFLSMAIASPFQNEALAERQVMIPGVGQAFLCTSSNQCATVQVPSDSSEVCFDFSGNMGFLNDQLKNVTMSDMGCFVYEDNECSGTVLGDVFALPGIDTFDFSDFQGHDYSHTISSLRCELL